jgi:hypothetical protein
MEENQSISFLYFLYKISYHYENGIIPVSEAIIQFILLHHMYNIIIEDENVEEMIKECMNFMINCEKSGYLFLENSKDLPFTNLRIQTENEEMTEIIQKFTASEEYIENINRSIQKKNSINRQSIQDVLNKFQKMNIDIEKDKKEEEDLQEMMKEDEQEDGIPDEIIKMKSSDGSKTYLVNVSRWTCNCPSFQYSRYEEPTCKHVWKVYHERNPESIMKEE